MNEYSQVLRIKIIESDEVNRDYNHLLSKINVSTKSYSSYE
ncbi:MAG TPA: hypothetical protein PKV73_01850 [Agriterribacter sp.]|nr:hypothetical protein [Agriterribacter sp.]